MSANPTRQSDSVRNPEKGEPVNVNAEVPIEARDRLASLLARQEVPGMAARVSGEEAGTQHAETCQVGYRL
ncbi:hypothetical protein [Marinobacter sp. BW6]|uniref:hypothetical protein n=1 Tax=Marinobacter sp. BW6 TaxID=2592624 RepID=UPI001396B67D|nr:hypothetical protein [Marinobacter sp. BW6]